MIYSCYECVWFKYSLIIYCTYKPRRQIRGEIFRVAAVKIAVLCDVTPCHLVDAYRRCSLEVLVYHTRHRDIPEDRSIQVVMHICRGAQIFQKSWRHLKIRDSGRVTWRKFHTKDPQVLGASIQNLVAMVTWQPGLVHPCIYVCHIEKVPNWSCRCYWDIYLWHAPVCWPPLSHRLEKLMKYGFSPCKVGHELDKN
jgi:hypothetical protein